MQSTSHTRRRQFGRDFKIGTVKSAMTQHAAGTSLGALASLYGITPAMLCRLIHEYQKAGPDAFRDPPRGRSRRRQNNLHLCLRLTREQFELLDRARRASPHETLSAFVRSVVLDPTPEPSMEQIQKRALDVIQRTIALRGTLTLAASRRGKRI